MSYNITMFKVKRLESLRIPVSAVSSATPGWEPVREDNAGETAFFTMDESRIAGRIISNTLHVSNIFCHGEGSGYSMDKWIEPALKQSIGFLEAVCIWEDGDTINRLTCADGVVQWDNIEL
jgi:hypothetical protein